MTKMSSHGCSVDTSLPETFLHERLTFQTAQSKAPPFTRDYTLGQQTYARDCSADFGMSPQQTSFDTLIDFYKPNPVALCSTFSWKAPEPEPPCLKKKSSSLKSSRSPNGGEKKIVRFADVLGLDLADVHTFLDEIPRIPKSAYKDLKNVDVAPPNPPKSEKTLVAMFLQPAGQVQFTEKLTKNKVSLENAFITNTISLNVRGTIRVVNIDFSKTVKVRYSIDRWKNFMDANSQYLEGSSDGFSDRFSFTLPASHLSIGQRLEFAINYKVAGTEYWDNNAGANYAFQCVPDTPPKPQTLTSSSSYIHATNALENWGTGSFY